MKIFLPELEIGPTEGFTPNKDIFNRAQLGKGLTNLVSVAEDPLVIAVDGQWGTGKTVFLKMWAGELRKHGFPVIHFDAFAHDYFDDAFLAIAGEIIELASEKLKENQSRFTEIKKRTIEAGRVILRSAIKVGVKIATIGALKAEDLSDLADGFGGEASDLADKYIGEIITRRKEEKETINKFKDSLRDLSTLLQSDTIENSDKKPLIFIIDELDRCRPSFAIALLERIKHFFSVSGVHFVLGTNVRQLIHSVSAVYGSSFDSKTYLQKFIRIQFPLVDKNERSDRTTKSVYIDYLWKVHGFASSNIPQANKHFDELKKICLQLDLSLREITQITSCIALALSSIKDGRFQSTALVVGLSVLKVHSPTLFERAKLGTLNYQEIAGFFGFDATPAAVPTSKNAWSEAWWRFATEPNPAANIISKFSDDLFMYNLEDGTSVLRHCANEVVDAFIPSSS